MNSYSDEKLVRDWLDGDRAAIDELAARYYARIHQYHCALVKDYSLAWDLTQDTFVKLIRKKNYIDPSQSFAAYLFRIAHNTGISWLRAKARSIFVALLDHDHSTETNNVENMLAVEQAVSRLPMWLRKIHELRMQGFANAEVAYIIGVSLRKVVSANAEIQYCLHCALTRPVIDSPAQAPLVPPKSEEIN